MSKHFRIVAHRLIALALVICVLEVRWTAGEAVDEGQCRAWPNWIPLPGEFGELKQESSLLFPPDVCVNVHDDVDCTEFYRRGECEVNPSWMWMNCYKACARCDCENIYHNDTQCRIWESWGECRNNAQVMWSNCYRACSLCEGVVVTHKVQFDIGKSGFPIGSITIGLFGHVAPLTVRNFLAMANHTYGFGYGGSIFHRVINNFVVQGGDITQANGRGGRSIYGGMFADEEFVLKHIGRGWVNMANKGTDTNESQFSILTVKADWLNGKHVVFGKVLTGYEVVESMEKSVTDANDKPVDELSIENIHVTEVTEKLEVEKKDVLGDGTSGLNAHTSDKECDDWAAAGDCFTGHHTEWMWTNCYRSCSKCDQTFTATIPKSPVKIILDPNTLSSGVEEDLSQEDGSAANCVNKHSDDGRCESWAAGGECERNPTFMDEWCHKACSKCNNYLKKTKVTLLCDEEWMALRCPENYGILIRSVFYGRTSRELCPTGVTDDTPVDCVGDDYAEPVIKNSCNLYKSCSGSTGTNYFGDPCPKVPKYLTVTYDCVAFDVMKSTTSVETDSVAEPGGD